MQDDVYESTSPRRGLVGEEFYDDGSESNPKPCLACCGKQPKTAAVEDGDEEVSHGLQLQSLWIIPTAAVS